VALRISGIGQGRRLLNGLAVVGLSLALSWP